MSAVPPSGSVHFTGRRCRAAPGTTSGCDVRLRGRARPRGARRDRRRRRAARGTATPCSPRSWRAPPLGTARRRGRRDTSQPSCACASATVVAGGCPLTLALDTAIGPVSAQQLERDRVQRHAQRDGAGGVAEVPGQGAGVPHDQRQRAGPERRARARAPSPGTWSARPSIVDQEPTSTGTGMSRPRPLAASSRSTASGVNASHADAVERVGGQHDHLAAAHGRGRPVQAVLPLSRVPAVVDHGSILPSGAPPPGNRAVTKRARPARSRWSATSSQPAKAAGALRPCRSECSTTTTPPGRSSRRAAASTARTRSSPSAPAPQGGRRVVLDNLRLGALPVRDVRRVADDQIDPAGEVGQSGDEIAGDVQLVQLDRELGARDVAPGPGQRRRVPLDGVHPRARHLLGEGERDRSRTGTQIDDQRPVGAAQRPDRPLDDGLGLRPGYEDPGPDQQLEAAEAGRSDEVLERFAGSPAGYQPEEALAGGTVGAAPLRDHQPAARDPEGVRGELLGVGPRAGDTGGGQPLCGERDVGADGSGGPVAGHAGPAGHWPARCSRSATSAVASASSTPSRSPSSTRSRLCDL